MKGSWQLRIYGTVELLDPSQKLVELPNRKVAELLAILSVNQRSAVTRDYLCSTIWPDSDNNKSKASLRQALALLRKAIGSKNVLASRTLCSLADDFDIITDIQSPYLRLSAKSSHLLDPGFADGCESDWKASQLDTASSNFFKFLKDAAQYDPNRTLATMKDNLPMVHSLAAAQVAEILNLLPPQSSLQGWQAYFRAVVLNETSHLTASYGYLQEALIQARRSNDLALAVQTTSMMCLSRLLSGDTEKGAEWALECRTLAKRANNPNLKANAAQSTGTTLVHLGQFEKGSMWYRRAEDLYTHSLDSTAVRAQRLYCEQSFWGDRVRADDLEQTLKVGRESGHVLLKWFAEAALANRSLLDSHPDDALKELHKSMDRAKETQNNIVQVFSLDALSRGFDRAKLRGEATQARKESKQLRKAISMKLSIWDHLN